MRVDVEGVAVDIVVAARIPRGWTAGTAAAVRARNLFNRIMFPDLLKIVRFHKDARIRWFSYLAADLLRDCDEGSPR